MDNPKADITHFDLKIIADFFKGLYRQGPGSDEQTVKALPFSELALRTSPEGVEFTSYNIMDYDFSYLNQFTSDQRKRVRHVLENSPLIPGPKSETGRSRINPNLEIPEPRTIKWIKNNWEVR